MRRRGKGEGGLIRRNDGRWMGYYTGSDAKRHYLYGTTRKGVAERLANALRDKALGVYVAGPTQPLETFLASWLRAAKGRLGPRTHERYAGQIRLHVLPTLGDVSLRRLTPQHLSDLYVACISQGLAPASVAHLHHVLHVALKEAVRWNLIARNPADAVSPPRPVRREMSVLTPDEIRTFLVAAQGDEHEALYQLAVRTGLRQGELLALRWRDIDLTAGWLEVTGTMSRGVRLPPKTRGSRRRVKLSPEAVRVLTRHATRMKERLLPFQARPEGDVLVFITPAGDPWYGSHLTERSLKPLLKRSGLRGVTFHSLRHAAASMLISQGVPILVVSQMLGHSSPSITLNHYGHLMPLDQESAVGKLDAVIGGTA